MAQKKSISKKIQNSNGKKNETSQITYFLSLELENVRCFGENQKIRFCDDDGNVRNWTIILGNNGTGKTSILQSLVMMGPKPYLYETESNFIRDTLPVGLIGFKKINRENLSCRKGTIESNLAVTFISYSKTSEQRKYHHSFDISGQIVEEEFFWNRGTGIGKYIDLNLNLFGYGASRKAGETSLSESDDESPYITLFDDEAFLINPEEWLLQADYALKREPLFSSKRKRELELVIEALIKILPDINNIRFTESKSRRSPKPVVEFHTHYGWVEAKDLSLGYRTSMAWMVDFASRMFDLYPESENPLAEPAVVLIDEIDLHLHPKWQRDLLPWLSDLFPNTQFIVTTHSPLIVQSAVARDANIVVCRREGDHVVIDQSVEALRNWRADQILTSDFFGLESARPKEIEPLMEEREKILSKAKLTKKDEKRLSELEDEIGFMPVSENPEDDKAMDIIRRAAERLESQNK